MIHYLLTTVVRQIGVGMGMDKDEVNFSVLIGETQKDIDYLVDMLTDPDPDEQWSSECVSLHEISAKEAYHIAEDNIQHYGNARIYQLTAK